MWLATFPTMITTRRAPTLGFLGSVFLIGACFLPAHAQTFTNLHSLEFTNGVGPLANLILSGSTLYGTTHTYGGGTGGGYGSVFKLNADGSGFTTLRIFSGIAPEGGNLQSGLVLFGSTLYGTGLFGGGSNYGCVSQSAPTAWD